MKKIIFLFCIVLKSYSLMSFSDALDDKVDIGKMNLKFGTNYNGDIYSGYLSANDEGTAKFYYMFYPSIVDSLNKPLMLWLNGGPGCSSLEGAYNENGPFVFISGTSMFEANEYPWTNFANMLYIESPISVGFSYGPVEQQTDESTAKYNFHALMDFFNKFPAYITSNFFIAGESYAGIYIPTLTSEIIDYNANPTDLKVPHINLEGISVGNGCTDPTECTDEGHIFPIHIFKQAGRQGFISEDLYQQIVAVSSECYGKTTKTCMEIAEQVDLEVNGREEDNILFNYYNIYGHCYTYTPEGSKRSKKASGLRDLKEDSDIPNCADIEGLYHFLRDPEVKDILHINGQSKVWTVCSNQFKDYKANPKGSYYLYPKIIKNGIRILKYSGDIDAMVPITGTLYWVNNLQKELSLTTIRPWRPWFVDSQRPNDPKQNAGYVVDLEGLTLLTIRGAGHMVTMDKRQEAYEFITKFIKNEIFN